MIYVSQGHEESIGLEVFIKSFLMLSPSQRDGFCLVANLNALKDTLSSIKISFELTEGIIHISGAHLKFIDVKTSNLPLSTSSLSFILDNIDHSKDILLTLPTSKDQLIIKGIKAAGYTEFLRKFYNNQSVSMLFSSPTDDALLVTDHIRLSDVSTVINEDLIFSKVSNVLEFYSKYFDAYEEVIFAGINPHVGEGGLLGTEDKCISKAIEKLSLSYEIPFRGPFSGDTLHFYRSKKRQLLVYMFHDQGLPWFKSKNHVIGLNISLGLPFLRMSVDHGTAFGLFKQNKANYLGCHYLLTSALKAQYRIG